MVYIGQVLHCKYPRGRKGGEFTLTSSSMVFDTGEEVYAIPVEGLKIEMGGAGDRLIYFISPSIPESTFYCSDRNILNEPLFKNNRHLENPIGLIKKKHRINRTVPVVVLSVLILLVTAFILSYDVIVYSVVKQLPYSLEEKVGEKLNKLVTVDYTMINDSAIHTDLQVIIAPIVKSIDEEMDFTFSIVNNSETNAFALPGGDIVIYSGLLQKAQSAEEVAGVVAHEIAHVTKRHHMRSLLKKAGLIVGVQTIMGDASALAITVAEYGTALTNLSFSRSFENEADRAAWNYLEKADIDPTGMISFFESLVRDQEGIMADLENSLSMLSTHPAMEKRIEILKSRPSTGTYRKIDLDYTSFKRNLSTVLGVYDQNVEQVECVSQNGEM